MGKYMIECPLDVLGLRCLVQLRSQKKTSDYQEKPDHIGDTKSKI